jgi:hypothetical protein
MIQDQNLTLGIRYNRNAMLLYNQKFLLFIAVLISTCGIIACSDDPNPEPIKIVDTGKIAIEFDNIVGDKNLVLNGFTYTNAAGESFKLSQFNYFISNIKLTQENGSIYTVPQDSSYFLVKENTKASQIITLNHIPLGTYTAIEFMMGVDSLRNTMPIEKRTGVLDPANGEGMYWAWNSGYIFTKMEGTFTTPADSTGDFKYHIGLYGGYAEPTVNNTRIIKIPFGAFDAPVSASKTPQVHLMVDVLKYLNGPGTNLKFQDHSSIMGSSQSLSKMVADNYAQMFTVDHIH